MLPPVFPHRGNSERLICKTCSTINSWIDFLSGISIAAVFKKSCGVSILEQIVFIDKSNGKDTKVRSVPQCQDDCEERQSVIQYVEVAVTRRLQGRNKNYCFYTMVVFSGLRLLCFEVSTYTFGLPNIGAHSNNVIKSWQACVTVHLATLLIYLFIFCMSCLIGAYARWTTMVLAIDQHTFSVCLFITQHFPNEENLTASTLSKSWHIQRWMVMTSSYVAVKYAAPWSALSFWQVIKSASLRSYFTPGEAGARPWPHNGVQGELK